ncbi:meiosis-specific nuclear structural protein 1-like [Trichoplusia ni]|uniref:Meiosis-specific nuclear structural protein 1 n=1 Tax=Trichoplusia ni TaxID=7111 RepID=A0A7E5W9K0_TRINI|nr:meiosis-specific nuclear structural protein 1-like [Trichoplusia ni]
MEPKTELQKNATIAARRQELDVYQRALDIQWLNSRMEDGRMGRCLALIQREAEMEKDFQERTDHAAIVNARANRETALGIEIAKVRREEVCQLLRRHYLRERDPSLRELARKLQAGYVCRDLQQQILHNEYKRWEERAEEKRANDILLNALYGDKDAKIREEREKMERNSQYCKELQQQLVNRQLQKQCEYEDTLIEKKMLEEIIKTMSDEDMRELQQKREQTEKMRNEMKTFQQARDSWREKQKELVIIEERKIEEQNKMVADRSLAIIAERERRIKVKEEFNKRIAAQILADEAARQERTNIIKLLQEQEYLEKNVQDDIAEREKLERVRRDTKEALTAQMRERRDAQRERTEKEAAFRRETEAKMADDEAKAREKLRQKREQGKLYSQELLRQIQENARRKAEEQKMEEQRAVYVWECDKKWQEEVSKEREKMIEEHVPPLLGYLQAGVVQRADLAAARRPKCNAQCRALRDY